MSSSSPFRRLYDMPVLLLVLTFLFWSGNFVVGRAVADHVPPITLAFLRWMIAFALLLPFAQRHVIRDLPILRAHWGIVTVLAVLGITLFNTLVYIGLHSTTALNGVLMQSAIPVIILAAGFLLFRDPVGWLQGLGIAVSFVGVALVVSSGDLGRLADLHFNIGDAWIFAAIVSYSIYSAVLRKRPPVHALSLLAATFLIGGLLMIPMVAWEVIQGHIIGFDLVTIGALAYVAVFPSILSFLFFNRAVELIGAARVAPFFHLMPLLGSLMAVIFLGEAFRWFHAVGVALIVAGIVVTRRRAN